MLCSIKTLYESKKNSGLLLFLRVKPFQDSFSPNILKVKHSSNKKGTIALGNQACG